MTGILAPRRQHLSCYVRSAERLANWEAARRCIVVAGIVAGCRFAALQRKTWRSRVFRGEWRDLHFLALVMVSYAKPARGGRSCVCTTVCASKYCKMHAQQGRQETMLGVDERGQGPDRKADRKRMRDVDVASVVVVGVKRRVKPVACGAVQCSACGQRASAVTSSRSALSCPVAACQACARRGWHGERSEVNAAAARPNLGDGRLLLVLLQGGKANVSARALDWTGRSEDATDCSASSLTRARQTDRPGGGIGDGREGGRREGGVGEVAVR